MKFKEINWKGILAVLIIVILCVVLLIIITEVCADNNILKTDTMHTINQHCIMKQCYYAQPGTFKDFGSVMFISIVPLIIVLILFYLSLKIYDKLRGCEK